MRLEVVSESHLKLNGCVASLFKMLTYYRVCCAFSSARALPLNLIWGFETTSREVERVFCRSLTNEGGYKSRKQARKRVLKLLLEIFFLGIFFQA
jgi:hypothetical protein